MKPGLGYGVSARPIPGMEAHRVAKDGDGSPALLIAVSDDQAGVVPVRLENLSVESGVRCRIWRDDKVVEEGKFTVLGCPTPDSAIRNHFLTVASPFLLALGNAPSTLQLSELLQALVEVFRVLSEPPRKPVQGLWAELFILDQAQDAELLATAWHPSPEERYDFSAGAERIEVKSAGGRVRKHHFSLDQLNPPAQAQALIASMFIERAGGGTTLSDLLARVRKQLESEPALLLKLETVVARTLGKTLTASLVEAYDEELARDSLAYFDSRDIPKPTGEIPSTVTEVRFVADLTRVQSVELGAHATTQGLFRATMPRK